MFQIHGCDVERCHKTLKVGQKAETSEGKSPHNRHFKAK